MKDILQKVYDKLDDRQAEDILFLEVKGITSITDYFIIASADNERKVKSLANEVEDCLEENGYEIKSKEGLDTAKWVLLDYGDVIVHIFKNDERDFYNIEKIWKDAINVTPN